MDAARQIKARFEGIFASMARPVRFSDRRAEADGVALSGYHTRGSGPDAGEEFRFREAVEGLAQGSLLWLDGDEGRWRVTAVVEERLEGELLFVAARVQRLDAAAVPEAPKDDLLASLAAELAASTLGPLEAGDVREALARLAGLIQSPADPGHAARIKARLTLLKDRFKACPQVAHSAKGLVLKLEAQLKRKGLP